MRRSKVEIEVFDDIVLLVAMKTRAEIGSRHELRILKQRKIVAGSVLLKYSTTLRAAGEIAARIETWLARTFGVNLDFNSAHALETLNRFGLLRRDGEQLFVPPIEPAIAQLHQVWNNFFKR